MAPPSLFARAARVALYAAVVHAYWRPQETLRLFGIGDEDLLAHVVRFLLTLFTYCFAAAYVSWFFYLGAAIFLQSACWVLYISKDRYLPFELDEATEKAYLEIGACVCYAVLAWIIFFGGAAEEREQFRNRLVTFYTKHNPAKLAEVDELIKKYEGNEELLFSRLHRKYNALAAPDDGSARSKHAREIDESAFLYEQSEEDDDNVEDTRANAPAEEGEDEDDDDEQAQDADNEESEGANDHSTPDGSSGDSENEEGFQVVKAPLSPTSVRKLSMSMPSLPSDVHPEPPGTPPGIAVTSVTSTRIRAAIEEARRAQEERIQQRIAQLVARVSPQ